jgi:transposase-like protein
VGGERKARHGGYSHDLARREGAEAIALTLDDLAREGARRMIAAALRAEAEEYVARFAEEPDEDGRRLVVRNGRARECKVTVGSGTVAVRAPRVNDKRIDEHNRRSSSVVIAKPSLTEPARFQRT